MPPITYAAIEPSNVAALLGDLLDSIRETMAVDQAVVMLLNPPSGKLVVTGVRGVGAKVLPGTAVPLGRGFAGRAATTRRPTVIENAVRGDVVHPLLSDLGIRSLLGVPIVSDGVLIGVLHIGALKPRSYTDRDVAFLQRSAERAAESLWDWITRSQRKAAQEIQRSLLPASLPSFHGVDLAARYSAGTAEVGGDWYDAFTLPTGELCLAIGDVAGHSLHAATVMGRLRSALRAYALRSPDPAEVLTMLNDMVEHFEPETTATVLYAVWERSLDRMTISSAGHWPPVLAFPGRPRDSWNSTRIRWSGPPAVSSGVTRPPWRSRAMPCCACSPTVSSNVVADRSTRGSPGCASPSSWDNRMWCARRSWRPS